MAPLGVPQDVATLALARIKVSAPSGVTSPPALGSEDRVVPKSHRRALKAGVTSAAPRSQ